MGGQVSAKMSSWFSQSDQGEREKSVCEETERDGDRDTHRESHSFVFLFSSIYLTHFNYPCRHDRNGLLKFHLLFYKFHGPWRSQRKRNKEQPETMIKSLWALLQTHIHQRSWISKTIRKQRTLAEIPVPLLFPTKPLPVPTLSSVSGSSTPPFLSVALEGGHESALRLESVICFWVLRRQSFQKI